MDWLRYLMIQKWRKMVRQDFLRWYHAHGCNHPEHKAVWKANTESLVKAVECFW